MNATIRRQVASLKTMDIHQLRARHRDVFGEETRSCNKQHLRKKIAWRIQAMAYGGLSERAKRRALEIANDADLRIRMPKAMEGAEAAEAVAGQAASRCSGHRDPRLPVPGTLLVREFKGQDIVVTVLDEGFELDGKIYKSLSAIAREVTGTKWNGFAFFQLDTKKGDS